LLQPLAQSLIGSPGTLNVTQVQLQGGKTPIVLYQEMRLQFELHVSVEPAAAFLHQFNWSGRPSGTRIFSKNTSYMYEVFLEKFRVPGGGPDQLNRCKEAAAQC